MNKYPNSKKLIIQAEKKKMMHTKNSCMREEQSENVSNQNCVQRKNHACMTNCRVSVKTNEYPWSENNEKFFQQVGTTAKWDHLKEVWREN